MERGKWSSCFSGAHRAVLLQHREQLPPETDGEEHMEQFLSRSLYRSSAGAHGAAALRVHTKEHMG